MNNICICRDEYRPEDEMICLNCGRFSNPNYPTDKKAAILIELKKYHTGKRNAVHSAELERRFSLDDRAVRRKISALRKEGYPICSGDMGYYYAESQKEINSTIGRLNNLVTGVSNARTGLLFSSHLEPDMTIEVSIQLNGGDA